MSMTYRDSAVEHAHLPGCTSAKKQASGSGCVPSTETKPGEKKRCSTPCAASGCQLSSRRDVSSGQPTSCSGSSTEPTNSAGLKEALERSAQVISRMTGRIQKLEAEVTRLRKILVDAWGEVPGEGYVCKDSKEIHHGST